MNNLYIHAIKIIMNKLTTSNKYLGDPAINSLFADRNLIGLSLLLNNLE